MAYCSQNYAGILDSTLIYGELTKPPIGASLISIQIVFMVGQIEPPSLRKIKDYNLKPSCFYISIMAHFSMP